MSTSYLIANCRRIAAPEYATQPNYVIAMNLFAVGSRTAIAICRDAGIDPDGIGHLPSNVIEAVNARRG